MNARLRVIKAGFLYKSDQLSEPWEGIFFMSQFPHLYDVLFSC